MLSVVNIQTNSCKTKAKKLDKASFRAVCLVPNTAQGHKKRNFIVIML